MTLLKQILEVCDLLDSPKASGMQFKELLQERGADIVEVTTVEGEKGSTDFIKVVVKGTDPRAPKLGVVGRLGGVGARPLQLGLVSDADGAIVALACAFKLAEMKERGDVLAGDVIIATHVTPRAPVKPYKPVPMMESPVDIFKLLKLEVDPSADAVISVDATKANRVIKSPDIAITPTIKEGWILKVSDDLIDIYTWVTGHEPYIVPITMQDITPFSTPVYHINSMVQPWLYTKAPVIGLAVTSRAVIPGSATGVTDVYALDKACRFTLEVAKGFTAGNVKFYDEEEYRKLRELHGDVGELLRKGAPR